MLKMRTLGGCLVAAGLTAAAANAAVIVDFVPSSQNATVGSSVSYDIVATITDASILGWGLDLTLSSGDGGAATLNTVTVGSDWIAGTADGDGLGGLAFPASVIGTSTLATIDLTADAIGTVDLILSTTIGDDTEGFALDPTGFEADVTLNSGVLNIVPEPTALALLLAGGVFALRRR